MRSRSAAISPHVAAVKVVEPDVGEVVQRCRECGLSDPGAYSRGLAINQKDIRKARRILELGKLLRRDVRLAAGNDCALFRLRDGGREQIV
jgi:hypothetical protein